MMKHRIALAVLIAALPLCSAVAHAQEQKIGYVDMQRVSAEVEQIKAQRARLKSIFEKKQAELDKKREGLEKEMAALQAAAKDGTMTQDQLKKKQEEFAAKYKAATKLLQDSQEALAKEQQKALTEVTKRVAEVVKGIATEQGYSMVMTSDSLLFANNALDLTGEVIKRYNAKYPK